MPQANRPYRALSERVWHLINANARLLSPHQDIVNMAIKRVVGLDDFPTRLRRRSDVLPVAKPFALFKNDEPNAARILPPFAAPLDRSPAASTAFGRAVILIAKLTMSL
jgi:hypothetical protein